MTLTQFAAECQARQRAYIVRQRADAETTAAGGLTEYQTKLSTYQRTTPKEALARLAQLDGMLEEIEDRYSEDAVRPIYELRNSKITTDRR